MPWCSHLSRIRIPSLYRGDVEGGWEVVDDGVEEGLDALVAIGGAAEHGDHHVAESAAAEPPAVASR